MLFVLFAHIKVIHFFEFLLQIIIFYNFIQILRQRNFYYLLSYFFTIILFLGIMLIFYDFDLVSLLLWLVYGSVIIIFFIYSLSWFESLREFYFFFRARFLSYFIFSFLFIFLFYLLNLDFSTEFLRFDFIDFDFIDYYNLLSLDIFEELEILGWGLIYFTSFLFILVAYFFFLVCCTIVIIIFTARQIKNKSLYSLFFVLKKNSLTQYFNIFKTQHFFIQEYENVYQNYTFTKNFKITGMFHKINIKRI